MKIILTLVFSAIFAMTHSAQTRPTTAADYSGTFQFAVSETNAAFPFVFKVDTETYRDGKLISKETEINERQAQGVERGTRSLERGGKIQLSYSIMIGFNNGTYCSSDGTTWKGPQEFVCPGPDGTNVFRTYGPRKAETVEYSVTEKSIDGKAVKVYRKYSIFSASKLNGKRSFEEEIATIDSRGFFISVVDTEGTLDPEVITLIRKQTWDFETKFKPVIAPK